MPLIETTRFREKLAAVEIELKALEMTQLRVVAAERHREKGKPDPASSILKIKGSEIQQATTELLMEVVGPYALPYQDEPEHGAERAADRPRLGRLRRADLFQLAQDLDLWRLERDPAEHHRQGDTGALNTYAVIPAEAERRAGIHDHAPALWIPDSRFRGFRDDR